MGQEDGVMNDRNLKPHDEDSDFPEFEFPVRDSVDSSLVLSERITETGNGGSLRAHIDDSPKKMPVRLSPEEAATQPEVSKHVVTGDVESKIPNPIVASSRKALSSNPSFKSLVAHLGEPLKFRSASMERRDSNAEVDQNGDTASEDGHKLQLLSASSKRLSSFLGRSASLDRRASGDGIQSGESEKPVHSLLSTPSSKRLSGILARVSAKIDATRSPERRSSSVGVNVLVERLESFSAGAKNPKLRDDRALSPGPRNLTSPRRVMADATSPAPSPAPPTPRHQVQESTTARTTPVSHQRRSGARVERSVSPVPRSWKDSVYGDMPKDRRPSLSKPDLATTPPPRFLTPTQAASMKTVKNPNSKSLQFTTAFGITTPIKQGGATQAAAKSSSTGAKQSTPVVTKPAGFNFRTDERAERRKDFNSKLEERLKEKEADRRRAEMKALEEKEAQLRELRKSLAYKANPVPRFYQEPAPAPTGVHKAAPTRAKSPNFTVPRRRDSCPATTVSELSGRSSPLRASRTLSRCDSTSSGTHFKAPLPKPKQPFRPI